MGGSAGSLTFSTTLAATPAALAIAIVILLLSVIILGRSKSRNKQGGDLNLPPGSYGWPILGETLEFIRTRNNGNPGKFVRDRMDRYNTQVFKTSLLGESVAVLCGPAGNKFLFSNEHKLVTLWWPASVRKLLGKCITTSAGAEGIQMRRMASYFFSPDAFARLNYIRTIDAVSRQHLNAHWQLGKEEVAVYPAVKLYTFELACRLFMSVEEPQQIRRLATLFTLFTGGIISIPLPFPGTKFYKAMRATATIKKELLIMVRRRRETLQQQQRADCNTPDPPQDLLSHFLVTPDESSGKHMSESVIVNNILLLLFAGHDTSSSAITMLMKILAENPHVYERVLAEQEEIASTKKAGEFLEWEDIQRMRYSWNVVCETIRLWPPVAGAFREALTDISYGGYHIPKGWKFYWNAQVTHGESSFFEDSAKFDPSRFEGGGLMPYTYVPFGGGPRMCLGKEFTRQEMLIFLHNAVRKFRWTLVNPGERVMCDPIPAPENGLPIHLHPH